MPRSHIVEEEKTDSQIIEEALAEQKAKAN